MRRRTGRLVTLAAAAVLVAVVLVMVHLHTSEPRLAAVDDPERALALIVGSTMDVQTALAQAPAWERRLYALTLTDTGSEIGQAIAWYEELADESLAPGVDLRLAILLGEAGRRERLDRMVAQWPTRGDPLETYGTVIAAAYLGAAEDLDTDAVDDTLGVVSPGWFADALALRVAARVDEPALAEAARHALAARGKPLLWRVRGLVALDATVLALGLLAAVAAWRRRSGAWRSVGDAVLPPPWSLGAGVATLVRGGALAAVVLLGLFLANQWVAEQPAFVEALDQPLMYLPLLLLMWRTLLAPAGLGFVSAFGLWPRRDGWGSWLRMTAVLVGIGVVIDLGLGLLSERLGLASHWTEWFDADLAWGSPAVVTVTLVGSILFAPIFEELIFRGLLYGTLRARLAWPLAALGSAVLFAFAHGYGVAGFLSVFLSGLLWAWVYERTGSLLPSMAAHVVNNASVALTLLAMLR